MTCAGNRCLPVFRGLALLGLGVIWAVACGGPQRLAGAGAVCFRTDDCQHGLACVPEAMGSSIRVCSADLSGIVSMVDGAPLEAAADAAARGSSAGSTEAPGGASNAAGATNLPLGGSGGAGTAGASTQGGSGGIVGAGGATAQGGNGMGGGVDMSAGSGGATTGSGGLG